MKRLCAHCEDSFTARNPNQWHCSVRCQFLSKVVGYGTDQCWVWTGAKRGGYGNFRTGGKGVASHRWSFEHLGGNDLIEGLELDHLCRNRACVNPDHLEQVTHRENALRGEAPGVLMHVAGVCKRGHSLEENAYISPRGIRCCHICKKAGDRARRAAKITEAGRAVVEGLNQ